MIRRSLTLAGVMLVCVIMYALAQSRDYQAERIILDDGSGNTITVQTPAGPITGGTLTIPDPGGASQFLIANPPGGSQTVSGDLLPGSDDTYDLGSGASRWQDLFTSGSIQVGVQLRLVEQVGGTDYVGFQAPAAISSSQIWTLPAADGTNGSILSTDGSGVLSWATNPILNVGTVDTVNLDFPSTAANKVSVIKVYVSGADTGTVVFLTPPAAAMAAARAENENTFFDAWVSTQDTVACRFFNAGSSIDLNAYDFFLFVQ